MKGDPIPISPGSAPLVVGVPPPSPALPILDRKTALFLDFDGTLVDIVENPLGVDVPSLLVQVLEGLAEELEGALAVVSGREIALLDRFLSPLRLPSAGVHGAELRVAGRRIRMQRPAEGLEQVRLAAAELAAGLPGVLVEQKSMAVAIHYRLAPEHEPALRKFLSELVIRIPGYSLLEGKAVLEVKPATASKGRAIRRLMSEAPFSGRKPIMVGDDWTDESGFEAAAAIGGCGIKVGPGSSCAKFRIESPASVRGWLAECCRNLVGR